MIAKCQRCKRETEVKEYHLRHGQELTPQSAKKTLCSPCMESELVTPEYTVKCPHCDALIGVN